MVVDAVVSARARADALLCSCPCVPAPATKLRGPVARGARSEPPWRRPCGGSPVIVTGAEASALVEVTGCTLASLAAFSAAASVRL